MSEYNYSVKLEKEEHCAKAVGRDLPISRKDSIEICNHIRKKDLQAAKAALQDIISKKKALPLKRFNSDRGHKKKIGPGKYPIKACTEILNLLESVDANAQFKGLNTGSLIINHLSAQNGPGSWHYGRQRRRKAKRTHIEIIVEEGKVEEKKEKTQKKTEKKEEFKEKPKTEKEETKEKPKTEKEVKETEKKKEDKPKEPSKEVSKK